MHLIEVEETVIDVEEIAMVSEWFLVTSADKSPSFYVTLKSGVQCRFREAGSREKVIISWKQTAVIGEVSNEDDGT